MRNLMLALVVATLSAGCATDLKAVREFAEDTRRISLAFEPILDRAVEQCRQKLIQRRIYTSDRPLADFDVAKLMTEAAQTCRPIANESTAAKEIGTALEDYATRLSAIAADEPLTPVEDDYQALANKLGEFKDVPTQKISGIRKLFGFLAGAASSRLQRQAIEEALSHEDAVGSLADALVIYTDRVYGAYLRESVADSKLFEEVLRGASSEPVYARLQMVEVHRQRLELQRQHRTIGAMRTSVTQMKSTMRDLRENLDRLSNVERAKEGRKLAKEVRSLYQQLARAF
jgi:hypothetical protein